MAETITLRDSSIIKKEKDISCSRFRICRWKSGDEENWYGSYGTMEGGSGKSPPELEAEVHKRKEDLLQRKGDDLSEDNDFVHIYKPKPDDHTFTFDDFNKWEKNNFSPDLTLWILLPFGMIILLIFTCCSLFFVFSKRRSTNRHPSSAAILHPPPTAPTRDPNFRSPDNIHGTQTPLHSSINHAFEQDRTDSDVPPDYTAVVLPSPPPEFGSKVSNRPRYPRVGNAKVETPPPAYLTVAPFQ